MIVEAAPAKINLALHVRRRRLDGYHDLETLFAFARDGDLIQVEEACQDRFVVDGPYAAALSASPPSRGPEQAAGAEQGGAAGAASDIVGDNLVTRARDAFRSIALTPPLAITLVKNLPVASGIGGGSADAAATLRALARLTGIEVDDPRLHAVAATLGADVPACLSGRTALGLGKGDALAALDGLAGAPLLLVNPGVAVSTAAVFRRWDGVDRGALPDGDLLARSLAGRNDLEPLAIALAPVIADVRSFLDAASGAVLSRMSGSGATCFALFDSLSARDRAARDAAARGWWTLATALA